MSEIVKVVDADDGLSALLRQLRFRARVFFRSEYCGSWAVDSSGSRQVPFHMVCRGEGWLHRQGEAPRRMMAGQLVVISQGRAARARELTGRAGAGQGELL